MHHRRQIILSQPPSRRSHRRTQQLVVTQRSYLHFTRWTRVTCLLSNYVYTFAKKMYNWRNFAQFITEYVYVVRTYLAWFDFLTKFLFHLRQFQDSTTFPAGQRLPTSGSIGAGRYPRASARRWRCYCQGRLNWRQSRPWSRYVRLPGINSIKDSFFI